MEGVKTGTGMKPIHSRAEKVFREGLHCVQFRIPKLYTLHPMGFAHALGLRYGLIGMAACHHLMLSADPREESELESNMLGWQDVVAEHVRFEVTPSLPFQTLVAFPAVIGSFAIEPIYCYLAQQLRLLPFEYYLEIALSEYETEHRVHATRGCPFWRKRRAGKAFHAANRESLRFASHFLERREAEVEEVPQIVLLGE
jgi:hypothetical protein